MVRTIALTVLFVTPLAGPVIELLATTIAWLGCGILLPVCAP